MQINVRGAKTRRSLLENPPFQFPIVKTNATKAIDTIDHHQGLGSCNLHCQFNIVAFYKMDEEIMKEIY